MIASGHPAGLVWGYTPRRIKAFLMLADRRKRHETAAAISLHATAARGDVKAVEKKIRELTRD